MSKFWQAVRAVIGRPFVKRMGAFVAIPYVWIPLLFLASLGIGLGVGSWRNLCASCPSIALLYGYEPVQTSKVYAEGGELIAEFGAEARTPVSVQDLPEHVAQAFVAIEDKRFYRHKGVDPIAVGRAVVGVLTGRSRRSGGGSTADAAARAQHVSLAHRQRTTGNAQAEGDEGRAGNGATVLEGPDPRSVHQSGELRPGMVRHPNRVEELLREERLGVDDP